MKRKYLTALPLITAPYILLFFLYCFKTGFLMDEYFDNFVFVPILILILVYTVAVINSIVLAVINVTKQCDIAEIMEITYVIKMIHIPAFLILLVLGLGFMITILFIVTFVFVCLACTSVFTSGLLGLSGLYNAYKKGWITQEEFLMNGVMQFVFVLDIVSSRNMANKLSNSNGSTKIENEFKF